MHRSDCALVVVGIRRGEARRCDVATASPNSDDVLLKIEFFHLYILARACNVKILALNTKKKDV